MNMEKIHSEYQKLVIENQELKKSRSLRCFNFNDLLLQLERKHEEQKDRISSLGNKINRLKNRLGVYADSEVTPAEVALLEKNEELIWQNNQLQNQLDCLLQKSVEK